MILERSDLISFEEEIMNQLRALNIGECELGSFISRKDIHGRKVFNKLKEALRRQIDITYKMKTPMYWYGLAEIDLLFSFLPLSIKLKKKLKFMAKDFFDKLLKKKVKRVSIERISAACANLSYSSLDYHFEEEIAFLEEIDMRELENDSAHFANRLSIQYMKRAPTELVEKLLVDLSIPRNKRDMFGMILNDERKRKGKNLSEKEIRALVAAYAFHIREKQGVRVTVNQVSRTVGLHYKTVQNKISYLERYKI